MAIKMQQIISDRGKRRLKIAANLLRKEGIKFDGDNFYDAVLKTINELDTKKQDVIKSMVDWVEQYEFADIELYGHHLAPARLLKQKTASRQGSSSQHFPAQKQIKKPKNG